MDEKKTPLSKLNVQLRQFEKQVFLISYAPETMPPEQAAERVKEQAKYLLKLAEKELCGNCSVSYVKSIAEFTNNVRKLYRIERATKTLEECIKKAEENGSWKGVDADEFMKDVRGEGIEIEKVPSTPDQPLTPKEEGEAYFHICNKSYELGFKKGKEMAMKFLPKWYKVEERAKRMFADRMGNSQGFLWHRDLIYEGEIGKWYAISAEELFKELPKDE